MTKFDQEMKLFEEIKNKYKPISGHHLVLDLDAYKKGKEILFKFEIGSEPYRILVNSEYASGNKDCVIITSSDKKRILFESKVLYLRYCINKKLILEILDKTPNPYKLKRSLQQEITLLVYNLNYPKPEKPVC
ncbi:MAG: hypothetical protein AABY53_02125 [Bdellovibrionota bacterium]